MRYLFDDCTVDTHRCELHRTGTLIKLRPKVFDVLTYLIAHRDRLLTRQEFLEHLWPQQFVSEATLSSCIMEARQAVGDTGQVQRRIQTLHGRGYRFVAAVRETRDSPAAESTQAILAGAHASTLEDLGQAVVHHPVLGNEAPASAEGSRASPDATEGERKRATILCCALTDARGVAAHMGSEAMYRLMRAFFLQRLAGPDTILMSEATRRLVQEEVRGEAYDALDMAVLPRPWPVYKVCEVMMRRSGVSGLGGRLLSPFVGRGRELAALQVLLAQAEAGQGQGVGIVGEPGIGKSRLLYEFARGLRDTGVEYLETHCLAYDQTTPYGPVLGLLRQLCGMTEADGPEAMASKLHHYIRQAGLTPGVDAPYLLTLLGLPEGAALLAGLSPEVRKARTLALLRRLSLHSQQGRARVIAVENVHWSDPSSEEYLALLADSLSGAPILLITTCRPGYRLPWLDKSYATQLALSPLQPRDSHAVLRSILSSTAHSTSWEQAIVSTAGGNPFFLEELAWAVREGGIAQPTAPIPDTVQAVLAARIDRLLPGEKRLLQTAAVIGHEVPLRLLQAIAELPEEALQRGLTHLQAGEFLYETRLAPDLSYTFKHALTHEVAYGSLLQERRRGLHARIAEVLETFGGERVAEQVERLAHHALRGEVWNKAAMYCQQAGEKAIARSAPGKETGHHGGRSLDGGQCLPYALPRRDVSGVGR